MTHLGHDLRYYFKSWSWYDGAGNAATKPKQTANRLRCGHDNTGLWRAGESVSRDKFNFDIYYLMKKFEIPKSKYSVQKIHFGKKYDR